MAGVPNALIGDPEEMAKYNAQGPGDPAMTSADEIRSGLDGGKRFAAADKTASQCLIDYSLSADRGIRALLRQAETATDKYLTNEQENRALIEGIVFRKTGSPHAPENTNLVPEVPPAPTSSALVGDFPMYGGK